MVANRYNMRKWEGSEMQVFDYSPKPYSSPMGYKENRKANLSKLVEMYGSTTKLVDFMSTRLGPKDRLNAKYLSQILAGYVGKNDKKPRDLGDKAAAKIEKALGLPANWMDQDHSAPGSYDGLNASVPSPIGDFSSSELIDLNVSRYQPRGRKLPVLAKVQAGDFREGVPARTPDDELWYEYARWSNPGPEAVWLIVEGDSMDDGTANACRDGDLILADPEAPWASGDYVIISNGADEWTFKRIRKDGGTWYMEALNPGYHPRVRQIPEGWRVVAKVLEVMPKGRKL